MNEALITSESGSNKVSQFGDARHLQQRAANESSTGINSQRSFMPSRCMPLSVVTLLVVIVVYLGWRYNRYLYLTPEYGPGYALGVTGALLMVMLLLYPVRKHARWASGFGPIRYWFRSHMLMGVLGPVCILFHCNFQLGSTNGNIALFSMLLVAGSGLVGRYFYTKIHYGLYGRKADLVNLSSDAALARAELDPVFDSLPGMKVRLQRLEEKALLTRGGIFATLTNVLEVNIRSRWCWYASMLELRQYLKSESRRQEVRREQHNHCYQKCRHYLSEYLVTVRKVAGFSFYERLFSMWHIFHLPIFVMLLITGIVHVYAVHMY